MRRGGVDRVFSSYQPLIYTLGKRHLHLPTIVPVYAWALLAMDKGVQKGNSVGV